MRFSRALFSFAIFVACSTSHDARPLVDASAPDADARGDAGGAEGGGPLEAGGGDAACALPAPTSSTTYALRYDALGYGVSWSKWGVVLGAGDPAPGYRVYDVASGCVVGAGKAGPRVLDTQSRAMTRLTGDRVDLSMIARAGKYIVVLDDGSQFGPIVVDDAAFASAVPNVLRFLGAQRCGQTTSAVSQHGACHLFASIADGASSGDAVAVDDGYAGAVDTSSGPAVDVEGGWHDAGDYIKFVGTTSYVLAVDSLAVRDHADVFASARAGAALTALRAELRWGLDWLVKMLSAQPMLHQVSGSKDHDVGWRAPESDTTMPIPGYAQRPVFRFAMGAGANLLGRAAAALSFGSQVFTDDAAYAASLLSLARTVYAAGAQRTTPQATDPPDFYPETTFDDDLALGAAALAQATGEAAFQSEALTHARAIPPPMNPSVPAPLGWDDVSALALLETALAYPAGSAERAEMAGALATRANAVVAVATSTPTAPGAAFGYAMPEAGNGSLAESLGAASLCLASRRLGGDATCVEVARAQLHWLFGQNPFGVSFMVGVGGAFPRNLHHSLAQARGLTLTGAIVGGPTSLKTITDDGTITPPDATNAFARFSTDDLLYDDVTDDYITSEPAIDFTAGLVFVLGELL